jgi:hypothetical protein
MTAYHYNFHFSGHVYENDHMQSFGELMCTIIKKMITKIFQDIKLSSKKKNRCLRHIMLYNFLLNYNLELEQNLTMFGLDQFLAF